MVMKFTIGEYVTRDGRKAVVTAIISNKSYPVRGEINGKSMKWTDRGAYYDSFISSRYDLIAPWQSYQFEGKELDMTMTHEFTEAAKPILEAMHGDKFTAAKCTGVSTHEVDTLRDKTFRAALTGLCSDPESLPIPKVVVALAYRIADEAMKQRGE
jgi:hypothetical protein